MNGRVVASPLGVGGVRRGGFTAGTRWQDFNIHPRKELRPGGATGSSLPVLARADPGAPGPAVPTHERTYQVGCV